ncbi:MAG: pyridoxamine 5'-phosphate oxidase family protein [Deltaproteobacteria bacterium]|nr:MAG: pyridoxamine 5'-phosphate oxidase family protein [Deltaproteobacteria bacterium]
MRRKEKEIKDTKEIEKILEEASVCRLAMVDGDKPYIVPMNFGYRDGILFFHSAKQGRKIDLIKKNPNVCFEVDQLIRFKKAKMACEWGLEYKSVIGSGRALLLDNIEEKIKGLHIIMSQYSQRTFEYPDEMLEKTLVIKIVIDRITGKQS